MTTKKKTSVVLPGGIAGLVHQVQSGRSEEPEKKPTETSKAFSDDEISDNEAVAESRSEPAVEQGGVEAAAPAPQEKRRRGRPATPKQEISPTAKAEREYKIVKDSGADSWDLFLDLGKIYKTRDDRLATIYIDPDLKRILDRLKTASNVKLPTAAILSSIVARFIFDHQKKINEVIFGERLI